MKDHIDKDKKAVRVKIFCLLIVFVFLPSCTDLSQEDTEKIIAKSEKLAKLNRFCDEIPKPTQFKYVYKKIASNSESSYISFRYKADLTFLEVKNFYVDYFEKNNWKLETFWDNEDSASKGYIEYRSGKQTVSLERVAFPDVNYILGCKQEN